MIDYDKILVNGEMWYTSHIKLTLFDIRDVISLFKLAKRLPTCFWEDIQDIHATNYSTIGTLFIRYCDNYYAETIGAMKPTISFLEWVYKNLTVFNPK